MKLKSLVIAIGLVVGSVAVAEGEKWELTNDEDGVKTWQSEVPGTSVFVVRGSGVMNQPLGKIMAVINSEDPELKTRWIDLLVSAKIIESGKNRRKEYHDYDFPFPANNRDLVLQFDTKIDAAKKQVIVKIESFEHPDYPESMSTGVRGNAKFTYTLTYLEPNKTLFDVHVWADPRGLLPKFMVNFVNRQWPLKTFKSLEREVAASQLPPDADIQKMIAEPSQTLAH